MNNKVNYTLVGFLVLVGFTLMLGFIYWLLQPKSKEETTQYHINFNESVLGLNIDAPVKYRGISVGTVTSLKINPRNSEQVQVLITILRTTPIKIDTVAKLTAQGITGLSYINLSLGSREKNDLLCLEGNALAIIKTAPSFFEEFEASLGSMSTKLSSTLTQTEKLLNDENQKQITLLLQRTAGFMDKLEQVLDDKTIHHLQSSVKNLDSMSAKIDSMTPNINRFIDKSVQWEDKVAGSFDSIMASYNVIAKSMNEFKRAIASDQFNIKDIAGDVVPTVNNTLLEMQEVMIRLDGMIQSYERSPGDVIFKQEEVKKGPGEK
ncbi:MAG: phospholipid/cholesterol/gamma-HCH transport system substrate-binding protein [Sulfurimonas sp.]|jgi:phospholipid/cholesterol/gamma-HCH transport system substrate-binding protein|uniref:MlaD family protein n=1 Tax=Sulfurimonas sp. TaxID=2022749 RepID=UPI0039E31D83